MREPAVKAGNARPVPNTGDDHARLPFPPPDAPDHHAAAPDHRSPGYPRRRPAGLGRRRPAASAAIIHIPDGPYGPAPANPVQVIAAGGMPGWQITVIALAAAATAVFLDRARASRRSASAIG